ncbi:uncharacterized protein AB9W97_009464 isoform 2-T2 [Spinachia spinachia]
MLSGRCPRWTAGRYEAVQRAGEKKTGKCGVAAQRLPLLMAVCPIPRSTGSIVHPPLVSTPLAAVVLRAAGFGGNKWAGREREEERKTKRSHLPVGRRIPETDPEDGRLVAGRVDFHRLHIRMEIFLIPA